MGIFRAENFAHQLVRLIEIRGIFRRARHFPPGIYPAFSLANDFMGGTQIDFRSPRLNNEKNAALDIHSIAQTESLRKICASRNALQDRSAGIYPARRSILVQSFLADLDAFSRIAGTSRPTIRRSFTTHLPFTITDSTMDERIPKRRCPSKFWSVTGVGGM